MNFHNSSCITRKGNLVRISFIEWSLIPFCLFPFESIFILNFHLVLIVETIETVFPCSRILYLCLESLGLDITSVILNRFKIAATYILGISLYQRIIRMVDSCVIHFWFDWKSFTNSKNFYFWIGNFQFIYQKYTYKVVPIY